MFLKLDLFLSSGARSDNVPTPNGPLERASLNQWTPKEVLSTEYILKYVLSREYRTWSAHLSFSFVTV
jgi:hypothetical protein